MNIAQDTQSRLRCLLMYHFLKDDQSQYLAALRWAEAGRDAVESHLRTGCFVHLAWIDKWGELSNLLATQHEFEHLRTNNAELHEVARAQRSKAQTRWSNYKNSLELQEVLDEAYQLPRPDEQLGRLMLEEAKARYARLLWESGNTRESELIREVEF